MKRKQPGKARIAGAKVSSTYLTLPPTASPSPSPKTRHTGFFILPQTNQAYSCLAPRWLQGSLPQFIQMSVQTLPNPRPLLSHSLSNPPPLFLLGIYHDLAAYISIFICLESVSLHQNENFLRAGLSLLFTAVSPVSRALLTLSKYLMKK